MNNISASVVILNGIPIPLGGADDAATFTPDPEYVVQDGVNGPVFSRQKAPKGTLTLSFYAHEPGNVIMRGIVATDRQLQGLAPLVGTMIDSAGQIVAWARGKVTQAAPVQISQNATVQSYTIVVGDASIVQIPTPAAAL